MNLKTLLRYFLCTIAFSFTGELFSQNLLDTSTWTVGSGNVAGFNISGTANNNIRELGTNHNNDEVVLWKAVPDSNNGIDGGWESDYITINNSNTYRLSVWIKKTNSNDGYTYFGTHSITGGTQNVTGLNGNFSPYPFFWYGDLPQLNRWYLLVGFVHDKNHSSTLSEGKIYDGVTGEAVLNMTDFKFNSNATTLMHRAYLHSDSNIYDRQYFWNPRIDRVDGGEIPINDLLSISQNPKLLFTYDNAGNQKQRFYCAVQGCSIPDPPAGRAANETLESIEELIEVGDLSDEIKVTLYPNPTSGLVQISLNKQSEISFSHDVNIYNNAGILVSTIPSNSKKELEIDLTNLSSGMFLVHVHLSNGISLTRQIIKN